MSSALNADELAELGDMYKQAYAMLTDPTGEAVRRVDIDPFRLEELLAKVAQERPAANARLLKSTENLKQLDKRISELKAQQLSSNAQLRSTISARTFRGKRAKVRFPSLSPPYLLLYSSILLSLILECADLDSPSASSHCLAKHNLPVSSIAFSSKPHEQFVWPHFNFTKRHTRPPQQRLAHRYTRQRLDMVSPSFHSSFSFVIVFSR
jgi:hypothetical protein